MPNVAEEEEAAPEAPYDEESPDGLDGLTTLRRA
jgi:hypothetical protein